MARRCPKHPSKVRYRTQHTATKALVGFVSKGMAQCRVYRCAHCGGWHSTSQAIRRRTGTATPLPAGFVALLTLPGHDPGVQIDYFPWRKQSA